MPGFYKCHSKLTISFLSVSKSSLIFLMTSLNSFSVPSLGVKVGSLSINLSIMLVVSGMLLFTTTFCSTLFSLTQDLNQGDCFFIHLRVPNSDSLRHWSKRCMVQITSPLPLQTFFVSFFQIELKQEHIGSHI